MKRILLLCVLLLLPSACGSPGAASTLTPGFTPQVAVLPSDTPSQPPAGTPLPPTLTATPLLIEGMLTIKVNVRSGPGMSYASVGLLNAGDKVLISAQEQTGKWYQVLYPSVPDGYGWVSAQFVRVPVWTQVPMLATPTPSGPSGRVLQRINVRSGPGLSFSSLGMLEPDTIVALTGTNATASWFQVAYPSASGGRGWVTAQYIQTDATDLPVLDDYGTSVASGPTALPVTSTPTVGPALTDGDSPTNPAIQVTFTASGTRQFTYSSQVSSPNGDPEDWVAFTPFAVNGEVARLVFSLECSGNGAVTVELWREGSLFSGWGSLACGDLNKSILLPTGQAYDLRLAPQPGDGLRLVDYILTVQNNP